MFEIIEYSHREVLRRVSCDNYMVIKIRRGLYGVRAYIDGVWENVYILSVNDNEYGIKIIGAGEGIVYEGGLLDNGFVNIRLVDSDGFVYDEYENEGDAL